MLVALSQACFAECDCTIIPFKPPPCFEQCVAKILSEASYSELTGKYGLPRDIAGRIISAREHGGSDWYRKTLDSSEKSTIDAIFREREHSAHANPKM
jgi:hypothetical protein